MSVRLACWLSVYFIYVLLWAWKIVEVELKYYTGSSKKIGRNIAFFPPETMGCGCLIHACYIQTCLPHSYIQTWWMHNYIQTRFAQELQIPGTVPNVGICWMCFVFSRVTSMIRRYSMKVLYCQVLWVGSLALNTFQFFECGFYPIVVIWSFFYPAMDCALPPQSLWIATVDSLHLVAIYFPWFLCSSRSEVQVFERSVKASEAFKPGTINIQHAFHSCHNVLHTQTHTQTDTHEHKCTTVQCTVLLCVSAFRGSVGWSIVEL